MLLLRELLLVLDKIIANVRTDRALAVQQKGNSNSCLHDIAAQKM